MKRLLGTSNDVSLTMLRLVLGVVFFAHGAQKMLGWFGGFGFQGTMGFFTDLMHFPAPLAFLAIAAEFFGGIGVNMAVAILLVHRAFGFFMNWTGTQKGEGFEFHVLVLAIVSYLMIRGAGAFSIDRLLTVSEPSRIAESRLAH